MEVTQTRLTNVYDSIEAYNAATTGARCRTTCWFSPGFPAGISERAAELLTRLARNGPRAGVYILATVEPGLELPRGFDLVRAGRAGTTLHVAAAADRDLE